MGALFARGAEALSPDSARFYVVAADGREYGPADAAALAKWVSEGRVKPDTLLRPEGTQARVAARTVPGLGFPREALASSQIPSPGGVEARMAWLCAALGLLGGLAPCVRGFNVAAPAVGLLLVRRARRAGARGWPFALGANLLVLALGVAETFFLSAWLGRLFGAR